MKRFSEELICRYCRKSPNKYKYKSEGVFSKSTTEINALIGLGHLSNCDTEDLPSFKITNFMIYDKNGHFCTFDEGLIEKNVKLYASGFIKNVEEDDPTTRSGVPSHDIGPIDEWFTAGYDGGKNILIGFQTKIAGYYLMLPNYRYKEPYDIFYKRVKVSKVILDYLIKQEWENPTYSQLMQHLIIKLDVGEEYLLENAHFICNQIKEYDNSSRTEDQMLISLSCMKSLIELTNFPVTRIPRIKTGYTPPDNSHKKSTNAATTKLVYNLFEKLFHKIEIKDKSQSCGICITCQKSDCGECDNCRSMKKFGGSVDDMIKCKKKRCAAVIQSEESTDESNSSSESDYDSGTDEDFFVRKPNLFSSKVIHEVRFLEPHIKIFDSKSFYDAVNVGPIVVEQGSFVVLNAEKVNDPQIICRVEYIYRGLTDMFHGQLFGRGCDTVLGETSDSRELFVFDICFDVPLAAIAGLTDVIHRKPYSDWANMGGVSNESNTTFNTSSFYFSKRYHSEFCTFTDYVDHPIESVLGKCSSCKKKELLQNNIPKYKSGSVTWKNEEYKIGFFIFYTTNEKLTTCFKSSKQQDKNKNKNKNDQTEVYRKSGFIKGSNNETNSSFSIALIKNIFQNDNNTITLTVHKFIRSENISRAVAYTQDWYHIYITDENISFAQVVSKCFVVYSQTGQKWCEKGPNRFYYSKMYSPSLCNFKELPEEFILRMTETSPRWPKLYEKLHCFDLFSGCGGFSLGLEQAGLITTKWAVEKDPNTCHAFKLNNPECKCFNNDCNYILSKAMGPSSKKLGIPDKNDVDIIIGGPPCQGFCSMNRFNKRMYSKFKNSLVVTLLSFVDYYRPKYFIFENVMSFASYMKGMVLKLFLKCLLDIDYQVTCGVLQSGHYGIPQNRRRFILIAAGPGYNLPEFPEPQHVFDEKASRLSFKIDSVRYQNRFQSRLSAPYRTITVYDAISDLPPIKGQNKVQTNLSYKIQTEYQRRMRIKSQSALTCHITKQLAPLTMARIEHIPKLPGADWRDLPNIIVCLSDGKYTNTLNYPYRHKNQTESEPNRSVCECSITNKCESKDRQENTLIPWSFVHTADKHNNWTGIYGRLEWDGYFSTTLTKPEPSSKQGRVVHPTENRIVSIRECARSQGLPDHFHLFGSITEKYRQIGNAVPPPLCYYIGMEVIKANIKNY